MSLISKSFRFFLRQKNILFSHLRIIKLRLLYQGIKIDFRSTIQENCHIACMKGAELRISKSHISAGTQIIADKSGKIAISDSFIGRNCVITAKQKIEIGRDCLIAEMVVIRDQDHVTEILKSARTQNGFTTAPIEIKENVWVASKATILKGVTIGRNSVIAASSVIAKDVPSNEIWAGIPGKFLKKLLAADRDNFNYQKKIFKQEIDV